jgi:hypothetical protein
MALGSSGRVVMTDAANAAEQRPNVSTNSRVLFTCFPAVRRVAGLRNLAYPTAKKRVVRPCKSVCVDWYPYLEVG